ncbi:MAG TPA: CsgG/HfaB family protein [Candidatus Acidoferrum sp.]|nr:CsgG/HfaB family protein [Candidatus Acidoferrum sp.]
MKRTISIAARHAVATAFAIATLAACGKEALTVAIFDFESKDEAVRDLGSKVSALLNATLSAEPEVITVERAELQKMLGEQELGLSGTVSADTAAKVGHLTGAKVLVTGRVFTIEKERVIVAKIISTETSRVYGELSKAGTGSPLTDQASALAAKIAKTIVDKSETLVAKVETRDQRVERLKKLIKAEKLPAVSVRIPEQHFGQAVRDPAAETELLLLLQQCGFTIVDEKSKDKADVEITGEAFSALGVRKGNLISCKSRVELKVHDLRTRTLLLTDRQTSVAVDVAEQTAAKTALQNAAAELADRVIAALAKTR